jgi:hypothetical protein
MPTRPPPCLAPLAALLLALAPVAHAAPLNRLTLVACAPGFPATTAEAQPAMDALAAALGRAGGTPGGRIGAIYLPAEAAGLARLGAPDAGLALVPLPFFLAHQAALALTPRLQVELAPGAGLERWSLVARRGRVARAADLGGFTVLSTAGYAPAFVRGATGGWGQFPATVQVAPTTQVLSALRKAAAGADVAVLLDGAQTEALASLPFAGDLEVVARSPPVPTSVMCTVGTRVPLATWAALERALLALHADPAGAAALAGVRMARFAVLDPAGLAAARAIVGEAGR